MSRLLATAAETVAQRCEEAAARADAQLAADLEYAGKNKAAMGKDYWQDAWIKRNRAKVARAIADTLKGD